MVPGQLKLCRRSNHVNESDDWRRIRLDGGSGFAGLRANHIARNFWRLYSASSGAFGASKLECLRRRSLCGDRSGSVHSQPAGKGSLPGRRLLVKFLLVVSALQAWSEGSGLHHAVTRGQEQWDEGSLASVTCSRAKGAQENGTV